MKTGFSTSLTCPTCFSSFGGHRIEIRSGEPEGSSRGIVAWRSDSCLQWGNPKWPKTLLILCCGGSVSHQPFHVYPGSQHIIAWNWQRRHWLFGVPQKQQISIFKVQLCWSRGSTRSLVQTRNTRSVIRRCFVAIGRWKISLEFLVSRWVSFFQGLRVKTKVHIHFRCRTKEGPDVFDSTIWAEVFGTGQVEWCLFCQQVDKVSPPPRQSMILKRWTSHPWFDWRPGARV